MQYVVTTETLKEQGIINQELQQDIDGHITRLSRWVVQTRDESVRHALIKLGWTPPPDMPNSAGQGREAYPAPAGSQMQQDKESGS